MDVDITAKYSFKHLREQLPRIREALKLKGYECWITMEYLYVIISRYEIEGLGDILQDIDDLIDEFDTKLEGEE